MVISSSDGTIIAEKASFIGNATNNFAEYVALIEGIKTVLKKGIREIEIFSDSELLVRQMTGVYKIKSEALRKLAIEAYSYLRKLEKYSFKHIEREKNSYADKLAKKVLDTALGIAENIEK